jgi:hypothetical protein
MRPGGAALLFVAKNVYLKRLVARTEQPVYNDRSIKAVDIGKTAEGKRWLMGN